MMADRVASHYSENLKLAGVIAQHLRSAGKDFQKLTTTDLATVDEFHVRGRKIGESVGFRCHCKCRRARHD